MKKLFLMAWIAFAAAGITQNSAAQTTPTVRISSFYYLDRELPRQLAEVCGQIVGTAPAGHKLTVTSDPNSYPGYYTIGWDKNGRWCTLVVSNIGHVRAELWDPSAPLSPTARAEKRVTGLRSR